MSARDQLLDLLLHGANGSQPEFEAALDTYRDESVRAHAERPANVTLIESREAAAAVLESDTGERRPMWRQCFTELDGAEHPNAIAPVCLDDEHDPEDPTVYSCCPDTVIEVESHVLGAYLVELLNADAEVGESA